MNKSSRMPALREADQHARKNHVPDDKPRDLWIIFTDREEDHWDDLTIRDRVRMTLYPDTGIFIISAV